MGLLPTRKGARVFVSWVKHTTRSASLAEGIGAEAIFIHSGASLGLFKYIPRGIETMLFLIRRRPDAVFCMNPPYFLPLVAWFYCLLFRARFVIDSHTAAFDQREWTRLAPLHSFLVKRAACSVVTNAELARRVEGLGGTAVVISDIPYALPGGEYEVKAKSFNICFVCTYQDDEPIAEVLEAARALGNGVTVYVTGNDKRLPAELRASKPDNVMLTGFLTNEHYAGLLRVVDAILVLTTRDFTMQRGGSEALTVGKPLVTSDWPTLREIFGDAGVYVENSALGIRRGVDELRATYPARLEGVKRLRGVREERWEKGRVELEGYLR
ncbi:MAG: glycosyltransferase [Candidatus Hydrogenedentota bacterium]